MHTWHKCLSRSCISSLLSFHSFVPRNFSASVDFFFRFALCMHNSFSSCILPQYLHDFFIFSLIRKKTPILCAIDVFHYLIFYLHTLYHIHSVSFYVILKFFNALACILCICFQLYPVRTHISSQCIHFIYL